MAVILAAVKELDPFKDGLKEGLTEVVNFWVKFGGFEGFAREQKQFLAFLSQPRFTVKQVKEVVPGITYRQLNSWDSDGLLSPDRVGGERGWRHFSVSDLVVLQIIYNLRYLGMSNARIKSMVKHLRIPLGKDRPCSMLDYHIIWATVGIPISCLVLKAVPMLGPTEAMGRVLVGVHLQGWTALFIPLNESVHQALGTTEVRSKVPDLLFEPSSANAVPILQSLLKDELVQKIVVTKRNGVVNTIEASRIVHGKLTMDDVAGQLAKSPFSRIEVYNRAGNTISLVNTEIIKP